MVTISGFWDLEIKKEVSIVRRCTADSFLDRSAKLNTGAGGNLILAERDFLENCWLGLHLYVDHSLKVDNA